MECIIAKLEDQNEQCHKNTWANNQEYKSLSELSKEEFDVLVWRSGLKQKILEKTATVETSDYVCLHHFFKFVKYYESKQTKCCDLFSLHSNLSQKRKRKLIKLPMGSHVINLDLAIKLSVQNYNAVPGKKLCRNCWTKLTELSTSDSSVSISSDEFNYQATDPLDTSLRACGISPFKSKGKTKKQKLQHAVKKIDKVTKSLEKSFETKGVEFPSSSGVQSPHTCRAKDDLDELMVNIKEKVGSTTKFEDRVQLLTLKPASWTIDKTKDYFEVTKHVVRTAIKLKQEEGILAKPSRSKRKDAINAETLNTVVEFYVDDEISREMPGKKDTVSIGYKQHKQKRLLLCNLAELFAIFKEKHPDIKIGLSKFCSLRPKWCKPVGSPGGHSVCVCSIHQNAVLAAIALDFDYKLLMTKIVCDCSNKLCMIHRCAECPGKQNLIEYLKAVLTDYEDHDEISFQQWQSTDRTTMITQVMEVSEYIDFLASKIDHLTTHSYISKCQARYLSELKLKLPTDTCIAIADFSENYSMVIQDSVQGWYFTKQQCTIHPLVLYYMDDDNNLTNQMFAFFSDDLDHDTGFLYSIQKQLTEYISFNLKQIKKILYFSDGCSGQYKNYKNFLNLTYHKDDFGLDATWNFFATGHGKSPCDGLGGSIKRKLTNESLKRTTSDQIVTPHQAFDYCKNSMTSVISYFLSKDELLSTRNFLKSRYALGSTVPGTRSFHLFEPQDVGLIAYKTTAEDEQFCGTFCFFKSNRSTNAKSLQPKLYDFVSAHYDEQLWVGMVVSIHDQAEEVEVKFMTPHGARKAYSWPQRDDICWIPKHTIVRLLKTPSTTSASGRMYELNSDDYIALSRIQAT